MRHTTSLKTLLITYAILNSVPSYANCESEQSLCSNTCTAQHADDNAAKAGCQASCIAQRAACFAKNGAEKTAEAGNHALGKVQSFIKGLSGEQTRSPD